MNRYLNPLRVTFTYVMVILPLLLSAKHSTPITGSDETLSCSNQVNVSVNQLCGVELTPDDLLLGDYGATVFELTILAAPGVPVDQSDVRRYLNRQLTYTVTDVATGLYCWGYLTLEDKSAPVISCDDCTDPDISDPDCVLNCAALPLFQHFDPQTGQRGYDVDLLDKLIPSDPEKFAADYITDNCNQDVVVSYQDGFTNGNCNTETTLRRKWVVQYDLPNGQKAQVECTKYYKFESISVYDELGTPIIEEGDGTAIEDIILMPKQIVNIPGCAAGFTPADIAAYFDDPATTDKDSDNNGVLPSQGDVDCIIENNEGIYFAFPHYYMEGYGSSALHAQPVIDRICTVNVSYVDIVLDACGIACPGNAKISRMWKILDWCEGTFFEFNQIIDVVDKIGPVLEVSDVIASVDPWKCAGDVLVPHPYKLYDACGGEVTYAVSVVGNVNEVSGNAEDGFVIHDLNQGIYQLVYEAEDCCGNLTKEYVSLQVTDETPPVPVVKLSLVVDLAPTGIVGIPDRGVAKVYATDIDNGSYDSCTDVELYVRRAYGCEAADTVWGEYVRFCCDDLLPGGSKVIPVEFKAVDWNGNENFTHSNITLEDKGSSLTCPLDMVLPCDADIWDFDLTGVPIAQTSCMSINLEIDTTDTNEHTVPRNKSATQGQVPGYIGVAVPAYNPLCGFGAMRRQWKAAGGTICEQWFVIEPIEEVFDPATIVFPSDVRAICEDYDTGEPTWLDATCELVGVTLESDTIRFEESSFCRQILNKWSVINWCNYDPTDTDLNETVEDSDTGEVEGRYEHYQTIYIEDNAYPTVESIDKVVISANDACETKGASLTAVGNDDGICASPWLSWEVHVDLKDDGIIDYIYRTNAAPIVDGEPNPFFIEKTSSGEPLTIYLPDGIPASKRNHSVDWIVNDGCRNETQFTVDFTIEDTQAPSPYCLNLGTTVMENGEVELWAVDFNVGTTDHCSGEDVFFTFTDVPPPPLCDAEYDSNKDLRWYDRSFWFFDATTVDVDGDNDCGNTGYGEYSNGGYNEDTGAFDDYKGDIHIWQPAFRSSGKVFTTADVDPFGFMDIPVYAWDECGNNDFCLVRLRIIDNGGGASGMVAGVVRTEELEEVEDVMTELSADLPDYPKYNMTDNTGSYAFDDNLLTEDYRIAATKDGPALNGVSTLDLVMIQRHILGLELLSSPYKMLAADVNNDQIINGLDLIELRKLILGVYTEFPQNESWRIIPYTNQLTLANPWLISEQIIISKMEDNMMDQDFIGVKIGDVDGSAETNSIQESGSLGKVINLGFDDQQVEEGTAFSVSFHSEEALAGFQFSLDLDKVDYVDIFGNGINASNVRSHGNLLSLSCDKVESLQGELFVVDLVAKQSGYISELLQLSDTGIRAEAYLEAGLETVALSMKPDNRQRYSLSQNEPNPFKAQTVITYTIPEAAIVDFNFFDLAGKLLKQTRISASQGENVLTLNASDFPSGVNYYKIVTGNYEATRQMIVVE